MNETRGPLPIAGGEVLVIVNPAAHNLPSLRRRQAADEWLREQGRQVEWVETAARGDAIAIAARAAERGVPLVFVCGGDGTLSEAAHGLAGSETALAVIPGGTVNLWARETGLLKRPLEAMQLAVQGERRKIDLGKAGDRHFLLMAGYGVDASVTHRVSPRVKGRLGAAAYALAAAREALTYQSASVRLWIDDELLEDRVLMVLAGNTQLYAGITRIALEARADDGLLDVCVYRGRGRIEILAHTARTLLRLHRGSKRVVYRHARRLRFEWEQPLPMQLDGDAFPQSAAEVTVVPGALWVAVPAGLRSRLFSDRPELQPEGILTHPRP
ncbi:MAG: diacylglycerol kinase family lipid kinase [Dehalococcoidia bacterium]|nr:diacylglycerol kinase family lipid kinase [Dehalococcoidia bacterium]